MELMVMQGVSQKSYTIFEGVRRVFTGPVAEAATIAKEAMARGTAGLLVFDDTTGRTIDIETRPFMDAYTVRAQAAEEQRGRGRPKLGVVAREVTLLPRHWEWLSAQPGGASVALRRLVDEARRTFSERDRRRESQERAYHFMSAIAGDLPGFEEASRALFAGDQERFQQQIAIWPEDVREHVLTLAFGEGEA